MDRDCSSASGGIWGSDLSSTRLLLFLWPQPAIRFLLEIGYALVQLSSFQYPPEEIWGFFNGVVASSSEPVEEEPGDQDSKDRPPQGSPINDLHYALISPPRQSSRKKQKEPIQKPEKDKQAGDAGPRLVPKEHVEDSEHRDEGAESEKAN